MKKIVSLIVFLFSIINATTIIVDVNGGGNFTNIQSAINAAVPGDTVKVWPGSYSDQVTLNKNIALLGSGYENTIISCTSNPAIIMSTGKLQWFMITSTGGSGVNISGGVLKNCVVFGCTGSGVIGSTSGATASIMNCIIIANSGDGIITNNSTLNVTNCISRPNGGTGFARSSPGVLNLSYSNGSIYYTAGNQGCINQDPLFTSATDFHISEGSPCWNGGSISLLDPDGSRSDMGYFGGPDCPIYPTVFEIIIEPAGNNINLKAKARANY